jgi:hypothetical protein
MNKSIESLHDELEDCVPPDESYWGPVQHRTQILPGMWAVHTAGHGGIWVHEKRLKLMPSFMRETSYSPGCWFEEDCDWCLPFVVFENEIREFSVDEHSLKTVESQHHQKMFARCHEERFHQWRAAATVSA